MTGKIFILHPSLIVREGLFSLIKRLFGTEARTVADLDELDYYPDIAHGKLIFLVDAHIPEDRFLKKVAQYEQSKGLKIILIREPNAPSPCAEDCACCFYTDTDEERFQQLLKPYFNHNGKTVDKVPSGLTEREVEVVKLIAFGKTNREIADHLHISIHTAISHRKNITEKLGIKSISGLTVYAILNNLIDTSSIDSESLI